MVTGCCARTSVTASEQTTASAQPQTANIFAVILPLFKPVNDVLVIGSVAGDTVAHG
jgi:hypothetical protein